MKYVIKHIALNEFYVKLLPDWEYELVSRPDASEWETEYDANDILFEYGEESPGLLVETKVVFE